jgi:hypothetical protein
MVSKSHFYGWYPRKGDEGIIFFIVCLNDGTIVEYHNLQQMKQALGKLDLALPSMSEEITFAAIFGLEEKQCRKILSKHGMAVINKGINIKQIKLLRCRDSKTE